MKKKMKIKKVCDGVYHVDFINRYLLGSTLMRIQEYYESPYKSIKGKYFSLEDFLDIYSKDNGSFTYFVDWSGFNFPSSIFDNFVKKFSHDFTRKEREFVKLISDLNSNGKYYIIASCGYNEDDVRHELAHAYFYLSKEYYNKMVNMCASFEYSSCLVDKLIEMGYDKNIIVDELQAYLCVSKKKYFSKVFSNLMSKKLDKVFGKALKFRREFKKFDAIYR